MHFDGFIKKAVLRRHIKLFGEKIHGRFCRCCGGRRGFSTQSVVDRRHDVAVRRRGAGYDDIVEVGVLLTNPADFAGLNEEYARAFPTDPPARYVAKLGVELPGVLVSVRMTAITS